MKHTKILSLILTIALPAVAIAAPTLYYYYGQPKEDPVDPSGPEVIFQEKFVNVSPHVVKADEMVAGAEGPYQPTFLKSVSLETIPNKISFENGISKNFDRIAGDCFSTEDLEKIDFLKIGEGICDIDGTDFYFPFTFYNSNLSSKRIECVELEQASLLADFSLNVTIDKELDCKYAFFNFPVSLVDKEGADPEWNSLFVTPPEFFFTKEEFGTKAEWSDTLGIDENIIHFV